VPRAPGFLEQVNTSVSRATFGGTLHAQVMPFFERRGGATLSRPSRSADMQAAMEAPPGVEPLAPPLPPPIAHPGPEFAERLARAVAELRHSGERLAEQSSADALEMAILIARRIIESELGTGPAALNGLIRSAIGRLGESRTIQLRLCPGDAAAVQAAGAAAGEADGAAGGKGGPLAGFSGLTLARVEVRPDPSLSPGDCIVDGEHGTVDGRLSTRLDEVRRILTRALNEGGEGAR
jgi:flagellar assembly protein FliH